MIVDVLDAGTEAPRTFAIDGDGQVVAVMAEETYTSPVILVTRP
jgi:hypothetical protein